MIRRQWAKTGSVNQDIGEIHKARTGDLPVVWWPGLALWDASQVVGPYARMYQDFVRLLTSSRTANDNHHEAVKPSRGEAQY
jgi:hypothetical protein